MNLKESFRYQNKLQSHLEYAQTIIERDSNIMNIDNTYLKQKATGGAESDEKVAEVPATEFAEYITDIAAFMMYLISEKEKLSMAIRKAKQSIAVDIDSEVNLNAVRQHVVSLFSHMANLRNSETVIPNGGVGYRFNAEGNQTMYKCDIKRVATINFDRNVIKKFQKELSERSDQISAMIDSSIVNTNVGYEAPFDVNDTFAEAFEQYMAKR